MSLSLPAKFLSCFSALTWPGESENWSFAFTSCLRKGLETGAGTGGLSGVAHQTSQYFITFPSTTGVPSGKEEAVAFSSWEWCPSEHGYRQNRYGHGGYRRTLTSRCLLSVSEVRFASSCADLIRQFMNRGFHKAAQETRGSTLCNALCMPAALAHSPRAERI